jgi:hypothetical protein
MAYHFGKTSYLMLGAQKTEGTECIPDIGVPITEQTSLKGNAERKKFQEFRKTYSEYTDFVVTRISAEGGINCPAYPGGGLEHLVYGVMGDVTHTDKTGYYQHDYTVSTDLPVFSVYVGRDELNVESYKDLMVASLGINYSPGTEIQLSANVMGTPTGIATAHATPSYGTERALTWTDVSADLGGSPNCDITSMSLNIDRGLQSVRTACAATGLSDNVRYATTTAVSGEIEMFFQDYTEYEYWLGGTGATTFSESANVASTARALEITASGQLIDSDPSDVYDTLTFTIPQIVYSDAVIDSPFDDRMKIKFNFEAYWDTTQDPGEEVLTATILSELDAIDLLPVA